MLKAPVALVITGVVVFAAQAGFMYAYLAMDAAYQRFEWLYFIPYLVFLALVLFGVLPLILFTQLRFSGIGQYAIAGAISGLLALFSFVDTWATMESAGAILHHIPASPNWAYEAPTYLEVLSNVLRTAGKLAIETPEDLVSLVRNYSLYGPRFATLMLAPTPFGAIMGALYWLLFIQHRKGLESK